MNETSVDYTSSTMTYESFTRRVWQARQRMQSADQHARLVALAVNYIDWINLVTDREVGAPDCRLHAKTTVGYDGTVLGTNWFWEDIPLTTDSTIPVGQIEVRSVVLA